MCNRWITLCRGKVSLSSPPFPSSRSWSANPSHHADGAEPHCRESGPRAAMSPPDSSLHHRVKEEPSSLSHCTLSPLIEQLDHTLSDVSHVRQGDQRTPTEQGCQRSTLGVCRHSLQRARDSDYLRLHGPCGRCPNYLPLLWMIRRVTDGQ